MTMVFVTHDQEEAMSISDTIVVMNDGKITGIGTHEELLASNEEYGEIYYSQMDKKGA